MRVGELSPGKAWEELTLSLGSVSSGPQLGHARAAGDWDVRKAWAVGRPYCHVLADVLWIPGEDSPLAQHTSPRLTAFTASPQGWDPLAPAASINIALSSLVQAVVTGHISQASL